LSHRQSDKKRPSSEPSELTKIHEQELIQAFEKTTCTLEVSQIIEEEPLEGDNIMEPTISQVESKEIESFVDNSEVQEMDMKVITMMSIDQVMCIESNILGTIESLTENLSNLKLTAEEEDQVTNEMKEVIGVVDTFVDSMSIQEVKENCASKELSKNNVWTELIKNEDHCECPTTVIIKKSKTDDEPMLFDGIKFKGKKKKSRKKNKAKDTIKLPSDEQNENNEAYITVKPNMKTNQMVEEDCDSAHSIDHSIDTNDVPNTICSDIRSVVSVVLLMCTFELDLFQDINYYFIIYFNNIGFSRQW